MWHMALAFRRSCGCAFCVKFTADCCVYVYVRNSAVLSVTATPFRFHVCQRVASQLWRIVTHTIATAVVRRRYVNVPIHPSSRNHTVCDGSDVVPGLLVSMRWQQIS